jgi:predicted metal-dependent enzyme (double-stranded beta helix superfamily)
MPITVSELTSQCKHLLKASPGLEGRTKVAALLSEILADAENVEALIPPETGERDLLFQDPEQGFCIFAHQYKGPKESLPHDHGPSWAIYAQARGETEMTDYEWAIPDTEKIPGKVRPTRIYKLRPGDVHVYNEGDLHAPGRTGPTSLIRIEGLDMSKIKRRRYETI